MPTYSRMLGKASMRHFLHFRIHRFFSHKLTWKLFFILGIAMRFFYAYYYSFYSKQTFLPELSTYSFFAPLILVLSQVIPLDATFENSWLIFSIYVLFIFFSLLFIWGGFLLSQNFTAEKSVSYFVLSVFSIHFAFAAIHPSSELMSMFFIPVAFYFLTKTTLKKLDLFLSSLFFSFATFLFPHNFVFILLSWIHLLQRFVMGKRTILHFLWYVFFFLVFASLSLLPQLFVSSFNFAELIEFYKIAFGKNYSMVWSANLWFYFFVFLLIFIPPFSFFLLLSFWKGISKAPFLFWQFVSFCITLLFVANIHEIKFLPAYPLFIILTALGLPDHVEKNWANPAVASFLIINFILFVTHFFYDLGYLLP